MTIDVKVVMPAVGRLLMVTCCVAATWGITPQGRVSGTFGDNVESESIVLHAVVATEQSLFGGYNSPVSP